ncbi:MAG TPA: acetyl-CoA carboxylase biotin carboxyl carrier protein [Chloroflexia bacterium]|nr:acetyl-CoA carboxylase biotin carboxyl carrier protein [Chloroflexia bacterium]
MSGSRFPFRESSRRNEETAGNRRMDDQAGNRRLDDQAGNRAERDPNRRSDDSGGRADRPRDGGQAARRPRPDRPRDDVSEGAVAAAAPVTSGPAELSALSAEVESLIRLMTSTDVSELQIESGGLKVVIRRGPTGVPMAMPAAAPILVAPSVASAPAPAPPATPAESAAARAAVLPAVPGHGHAAAPVLAGGEHLISSPMVGTFYAAPSPQEPPYVTEGDEVAAGQTVGIVEAMKMMNPIEAEVAGRVTRILVKDGQGVEYGTPLMIIAQ